MFRHRPQPVAFAIMTVHAELTEGRLWQVTYNPMTVQPAALVAAVKMAGFGAKLSTNPDNNSAVTRLLVLPVFTNLTAKTLTLHHLFHLWPGGVSLDNAHRSSEVRWGMNSNNLLSRTASLGSQADCTVDDMTQTRQSK